MIATHAPDSPGGMPQRRGQFLSPVTPTQCLALWLVKDLRAEYMLCVRGDCLAQSPSYEVLVLCDQYATLKRPQASSVVETSLCVGVCVKEIIYS